MDSSNEKSKLISREFKAVSLVILISSFILISIWFRDGNIMGGGESGLPFHDLTTQGEEVRNAWSDKFLGNSVGISVGSFPTYWVLARIQNLGIPSFIIEAFFYWGLLIVAALSMYFLTKVLFANIKPRFVLLAVFFYLFNPITLVNVWNRGLENFRVFWAFLPLFLLLYLLGLKNKKYIFAVVIGLATGIFSYALTAIPFDILLGIVSLYASIFYFLTDKTRKEKLFDIVFLLFTLISVILVNFWWISQLFNSIFLSDFNVSVKNFYSLDGNIYTLSVESQLLGQWSYILRFFHKIFYTQGPGWVRIYLSTPINLVAFAIPIVIFWGLIRFRKIKEVIFLGILWIATLFLIRGNQAPFGGIFEYFFVKIFAFQAFRNPFEKFGFLLPLTTAPLFAFVIQKISIRLTNVFIGRFIVAISFIYVVALWGFPFWTGLVFTRGEEYDKTKLISYKVKVPEYYSKANKWINLQGNDFRFISLPLGGEGMTYTWTKPYSGVELTSTLFDTPNISFNTSIPYFTEIASYLSDYQFDKKILDFLPYINARFIIVRSDIDFRERNLPNPKDVEANLEQWAKEGLVTKKYEEDKLIIYEVDKKSVWPKIYMTSQVITSNEDNLSQFRKFTEGFPIEPLAIVNSSWSGANQTQNRLLKPIKILSSSNTLPTELNFSLPISGSDYFVSYSFNIPFSGKYKMLVDDNWGGIKWFLDGKELNIRQQDEISLDKGLHELVLIGRESDFLLPIISENGFLVSNSNQYKQKFILPTIPASYQLSFNYMYTSNFLGQGRFNVNLVEDIDNSLNPVFTGTLVQNNYLNTWIPASFTIKTRGGARLAELQIIPSKDSGNLSFSGAIKNLLIKQIQHPEPVLISALSLKSQETKTILEWEKVNPSKYKIKFRKQGATPEVMVFSELFNSGWNLKQEDKQVAGDRHFLVNAYANGWLFDKQGNYDLILEFGPQRFLNIGARVSILSFIAGTLLLGLQLRRWYIGNSKSSSRIQQFIGKRKESD